MACAFLEENDLCRCTAVRGLLIPSIYERERYCYTDDPGRCPTHRARARRHDAMPEEVYYALWLPRTVEPEAKAEANAVIGVSPRHVLDEDMYVSCTAD